MTLKEYVSRLKDKKIAVVGIGISNLPLIKLLAGEGCDVTACDKRGEEELAVTSDKSFVLNDLMNGDYYILVQGTGDEYDSLNACYEYYVPEESKGFLMAFRPEKSTVEKQTFILRGLEPDATYLIESADNGETIEADGKTLMTDGLTMTFSEARMSLLVYITKK